MKTKRETNQLGFGGLGASPAALDLPETAEPLPIDTMKLLTHHGLDAFECISTLQKAIRRGMEELAMEMACELMHTSKAFFTMACNRIEVTAHEDVGLPDAIQFTALCLEQAKRHYKPDKIGPARLMVGNVIRYLCASERTRAGTHFAAAIGLENLGGKVPQIPEWAYDVHTAKGRKMGRDLDHFLEHGAKLSNEVQMPDHYFGRAKAQWAKKYGATANEQLPLENGEQE